jgi:hypothetical protein
MIMQKSWNRNLSLNPSPKREGLEVKKPLPKPLPQEGGALRTTRQETIIPRSPGSGGKEGVKQKKEGVIM